MAKPKRSMYRYEVAIDDQAHTIRLTGEPVAVAAAGRVVEFWAEHYADGESFPWTFQVFGTGHPVPERATWIGTCDRDPAGLVWHLFTVEGSDV